MKCWILYEKDNPFCAVTWRSRSRREANEGAAEWLGCPVENVRGERFPCLDGEPAGEVCKADRMSEGMGAACDTCDAWVWDLPDQNRDPNRVLCVACEEVA